MAPARYFMSTLAVVPFASLLVGLAASFGLAATVTGTAHPVVGVVGSFTTAGSGSVAWAFFASALALAALMLSA